MGTWSAHAFGNDDAMEWVEELEDQELDADDWEELLGDAFDAAEGASKDPAEDYTIAAQALAACEVVASLLGHASDETPERLVDLLPRRGMRSKKEALRNRAVAVIERIRTHDGAIKRHWDANAAKEEWYEALADLERRLSET